MTELVKPGPAKPPQVQPQSVEPPTPPCPSPPSPPLDRQVADKSGTFQNSNCFFTLTIFFLKTWMFPLTSQGCCTSISSVIEGDSLDLFKETNNLDTNSAPLLDRIEVLEVSSYVSEGCHLFSLSWASSKRCIRISRGEHPVGAVCGKYSHQVLL